MRYWLVNWLLEHWHTFTLADFIVRIVAATIVGIEVAIVFLLGMVSILE